MGLNCLLISTNLVQTPYPVYPLGVAHLAGALEAAGHDVVHFDILASSDLESLAAVLEKSQFDLIGLSIRNLESPTVSPLRCSLLPQVMAPSFTWRPSAPARSASSTRSGWRTTRSTRPSTAPRT